MDNLRFFWHFDVLRQGVVVEGHIQACSIETKTVVTKAGSLEETVYTLIYSFDYNETNYVQSNVVSLRKFNRFQEGDRVKVYPPHSVIRSATTSLRIAWDIRIGLTTVFATEEQVVLEGMFRGANTGSRNLPTGALKASGHPGELRCCFVAQIRQRKIISLHGYYDLTTLLEQLGLKSATAQAM